MSAENDIFPQMSWALFTSHQLDYTLAYQTLNRADSRRNRNIFSAIRPATLKRDPGKALTASNGPLISPGPTTSLNGSRLKLLGVTSQSLTSADRLFQSAAEKPCCAFSNGVVPCSPC